ncbi:GH-E family nuclease, partial [Listeria sp. ILCC792]|uniref:GH-E family nuclease n=2 Tax=Listeriaceae TaxID=186820 RepID=UPI002101C1CE
EEEKILENYLQFEQSHTHFFQELLALVMTAQRTMRQLLQEVEFNAQTGTYTYPKGYTQSMDALKQRLNTVRGVDPKLVEALKAYQVLAVVYYDAEGKPQVMWLLEQNGVGVHDPKLKKYLDKAGKYLDPSDYQIITNEELNKKITESWKTGTYYMDGTQYTGMAGGTLRASAYVESVKGTLDESGLMDVVMGLGLSTAAIRGSMTYEGAGGTTSKIDEVTPRILTEAEKKAYKRPSGYRKGVRDEVWNNAKSSDGIVRDPLTQQPLHVEEPWDMGHKPGYEFKKHQQSAADREIPRKQFLDEHNDPSHYRPELPSSNRGHAGEDVTNKYFGP